MNYLALWQSLYREKLVVSSDAPPAPAVPIAMPWLGRVLMAFLGWMSGLFSVGALALPFSIFSEVPGAFLVISAGLLFAAYRLFVAAKQSEFLAQFALAISVAGQFAMVFSLFQLFGEWSISLLATISLVVQVALIGLMPNATHRALSTLFALAALGVLLEKAGTLSLFPAAIAAGAAVLWLTESRWVSQGRDALLRPVANALWLALLLICSFSFMGLARELSIHMPTGAIALAVVWIVYLAFVTHGMETILRIATLLGGAIFAYASLPAPGLIACAIALTIAFARGSRAATALALIGFVSYLFGYYYQTQNTLMDKAITLAIIAAACWVAAVALRVLRGKV
ncbi:MAG: DUF4401 domain-containing protein [Casimicrobium sp.]